ISEVQHPLRLLLVRRDLADDLLAQPPLRLEDRLVLRDEAVLVLVQTETLDRFVLRHGSSLDSVCRRRWVAFWPAFGQRARPPRGGGIGRASRGGRPRPKGLISDRSRRLAPIQLVPLLFQLERQLRTAGLHDP